MIVRQKKANNLPDCARKTRKGSVKKTGKGQEAVGINSYLGEKKKRKKTFYFFTLELVVSPLREVYLTDSCDKQGPVVVKEESFRSTFYKCKDLFLPLLHVKSPTCQLRLFQGECGQ